jgi:tetratricopeptide (TPR) repeat protein
VKYCYNCAQQLTLGTENFCPKCGIDLKQQRAGEKDSNYSIGITDTKGDILGAGFSGSGNIIGKEVAYTVQGNILNFNISGGSSISKEFIEQLQKMVAVPTQLESQTSPSQSTTEDNMIRLEETNTTKQQISNILNEVNKIDNEKGTQIQEVKAGDLQISRNQLLLKEYVLKGNEHHFKKEYSEAIEWYDKAIEINPNYVDAWNNKGIALEYSGKHKEAIEYYDKALQLDPKYVDAWNNKGLALYNSGKHKEAIEYYDKALQLDPGFPIAWNNKGLALYKLGKYDEAIESYDQAIKIMPDYANAWYNKGVTLDKLGRHNEAKECHNKDKELRGWIKRKKWF